MNDYNLLHTLEKKLIALEGLIAGLSLLSMLVLSLIQIFVRNVFSFGYPEIEILNRHLLVVCGMMGAVLATSQLRHIKIDALTVFLSAKSLQLLRYPLALFSTAVCIAFCYYSVIFCIDEWDFAPANERWILPFTFIYPVGFALLSLHFIIVCFKKESP